MIYLSLLMDIKQGCLGLLIVFVLADVPNLKLALRNMGCERGDVVILRKGDMIYLRNELGSMVG